MTKEPVTLAGAVLALLNSVLGGGVILGIWTLTPEGIAAFMLIAGNLFIVLTMLFARAHTVSLSENREQVATALATPADPIVGAN